MVIFAYIDTNIRNLNEDRRVDRKHDVSFCEYTGKVDIKRDVSSINPENGILGIYNLQAFRSFEGSKNIKRALIDRGEFLNLSFIFGSELPSNYDRFPTMFELERLMEGDIEIEGLSDLKLDGLRSLAKDHSYFQGEEKLLSKFRTSYAQAVAASKIGKPVMEGMYQAFQRGYRMTPLQPEIIFGERLYQELNSQFGNLNN